MTLVIASDRPIMSTLSRQCRSCYCDSDRFAPFLTTMRALSQQDLACMWSWQGLETKTSWLNQQYPYHNKAFLVVATKVGNKNFIANLVTSLAHQDFPCGRDKDSFYTSFIATWVPHNAVIRFDLQCHLTQSKSTIKEYKMQILQRNLEKLKNEFNYDSY